MQIPGTARVNNASVLEQISPPSLLEGLVEFFYLCPKFTAFSNSYKTSVDATHLAWMDDQRHMTVHVRGKLAECADNFILYDVAIGAAERV